MYTLLCSACMYAYTSKEDTRSCYRWLWDTMWLLGTEPRTSRRTASALDLWAISPAPARWVFFLVPSVLSGCYSFSVSSFTVFLSPEGRGLIKTPYLRLSVPKTLILSLYSVWLWASLHLFPSVAGGSFCDDGWARHWLMSTAECQEESLYCYFFFFNTTIVFGFTQGSLGYLI